MMAAKYRELSDIEIECCVAAEDGILIWTLKLLDTELEELGIGPSKFMCRRKKIYGLNMQACCGADKCFIDFGIKHPATTSDYLAFTTLDLNKKLEGESFVLPGQPFLYSLLAILGRQCVQ